MPFSAFSRNGVVGDIVECGVAHGGSAALLGLSLKQIAEHYRMWLFDTFSGIPAPTGEDPDYEIAKLYTGKFGASVNAIRATLSCLGVEETLEFVSGLFQKTVPQSSIESIASFISTEIGTRA